MESVIVATACALITSGTAFYHLGLRYGRHRGIEEGSARAAVMLRQRALIDGVCPICHPGTPYVPTSGEMVYHTEDWMEKGEVMTDDESGKSPPRPPELGAGRGGCRGKYDESGPGI
jgi:hypothetical protein